MTFVVPSAHVLFGTCQSETARGTECANSATYRCPRCDHVFCGTHAKGSAYYNRVCPRCPHGENVVPIKQAMIARDYGKEPA